MEPHRRDDPVATSPSGRDAILQVPHHRFYFRGRSWATSSGRTGQEPTKDNGMHTLNDHPVISAEDKMGLPVYGCKVEQAEGHKCRTCKCRRLGKCCVLKKCRYQCTCEVKTWRSRWGRLSICPISSNRRRIQVMGIEWARNTGPSVHPILHRTGRLDDDLDMPFRL